jgi:hypothetical protein
VIFLGIVTALFCWLPLRQIIAASSPSARSFRSRCRSSARSYCACASRPSASLPHVALSPPRHHRLGLWGYVVVSPEKHLRVAALYVIGAGALFFFLREALVRRANRTAVT